MSYDVLKKEIKDNVFRNIYLFYGEESYLKDYYINQIFKANINEALKDMNFLIMDETSASPQGIVGFCESFPMMDHKKMLIIKKTNLLKNKKSAEGLDIDGFTEYLDNIPPYAIIIFAEGGEIDKRVSMYKYIEKNGLVVEFSYQTREQLANWVQRFFNDNNKKITKEDILYIVDNTDPDMQSILNECNKLLDYSFDKGVVERKDMEALLTRSLSSQVFEMVDNIVGNNTSAALQMLDEMLCLKEPAPKILALIARQIRLMLQAKAYQNEGLGQNEIAKKAGVNYIYKYLKQGEKFSIPRLEKLLIECSEADLMIKSSSVDDRIVLEKLIMQIAQ